MGRKVPRGRSEESSSAGQQHTGAPSSPATQSRYRRAGGDQLSLARLTAAELTPGQVAELRQQLDEARDRYHDLFDFAPLGILSIDRDGIVHEANTRACALLGSPARHLLGRTLLASVHAEDQRKFAEELEACCEEMRSAELRFTRADGHSFPAQLVLSPSAGARRELIRAILVDLTERVRFERERLDALVERNRLERERDAASQRSEAKDRFLAILSHELRTPLTPLMFAVARLRSLDGMPQDAAPLLDMIQRNLDIEAQLIGDLLDVHRIALGKVSLDMRPVDLHEVLHETADVVQRQYDEREVDLGFALDAGTATIVGDRARLRQVFWNLLSNALKFTPPHGRVTIASTNPDAGRIVVSVRDTGIGIAPETIPRLFEAFEQSTRGDATLGGLGLGLTICRGLVDAHDGRLRAHSDGPGHGTTFECEFATLPEGIARAGSTSPARAI